MDIKAKNVNISFTYKCPLTEEEVKVDSLEKSWITVRILPSMWDDVDDGYEVGAWWYPCPSCKQKHDITILKESYC